MIGKLYRETIVSSMALIFGMAKPRYTAIVEGRTGLVRRCLQDGERDQRFIFFHVTHTTKSLGWTYFLGAVVLHTKQSAMQLSCCLLLGRKRNHIILYHLWPQAGAGCGCWRRWQSCWDSRRHGERKLLEILFLGNFGLKVAKSFALVSGWP